MLNQLRYVLVGALLAVLTLAGCAGNDQTDRQSTGSTDLLAALGFEGMDAKAVIEQLETTPVAERDSELRASIKPDVLELSDEAGRTATLTMPSEEFYVSFAPYVSQTHDCFFHSLTTCLGEMRSEQVAVKVVDNADNSVLFDESVTTEDNGFTGLWLPRDLDATLTVEQDGRVGSVPLGTSDDDPTCVTTLQLS